MPDNLRVARHRLLALLALAALLGSGPVGLAGVGETGTSVISTAAESPPPGPRPALAEAEPETPPETSPETLPEAPNIDLKEVVETPIVPPPADPADKSEPGEPTAEQTAPAVADPSRQEESGTESPPAPTVPDGVDVAAIGPIVGPPVPADLDSITLLGTRVPPQTSTRLAWSPSESFAGIAVPTPVLVVNGSAPGPVLCLTGAVHGDELNGIEIVRRLMYEVDTAKLTGTIIGVPIVNLQGFHRGSRYLTDRRDLNRHFPGNPRGSAASRIAHSFFEKVVLHCDALVDLHTGSFHRTNLPQVRADLTRPEVRKLAEKFGATVVLHTVGSSGTLRRAAVEAGIPAVTIEAGEPLRLQEREVEHGVKSLRRLLDQMGMYGRFSLWADPEPVYYESTWIRSDAGGILLSAVKLGARVDSGALLGTVIDPITNATSEIRIPFAGRILGMAVNQVVMPGYAAYHVGVRAEPDVIHPASAASNAKHNASGSATTTKPASGKAVDSEVAPPAMLPVQMIDETDGLPED